MGRIAEIEFGRLPFGLRQGWMGMEDQGHILGQGAHLDCQGRLTMPMDMPMIEHLKGGTEVFHQGLRPVDGGLDFCLYLRLKLNMALFGEDLFLR